MAILHTDGGADEVVGRLAEGLVAHTRAGKAHAAHICSGKLHCCPHRACTGNTVNMSLNKSGLQKACLPTRRLAIPTQRISAPRNCTVAHIMPTQATQCVFQPHSTCLPRVITASMSEQHANHVPLSCNAHASLHAA